MKSFQHTESRCPQCNYKLDASTHIEGGEPSLPQPGDASVCLNCGQVLMFEAECRIRKATAQDIDSFMTSSPEGWAVIEKAQSFIHRRGRFV